MPRMPPIPVLDTDMISSLPDEVICHILSFLPTENSVATSVLSKRWSPLWRSVPALNLGDKRIKGNESCRHFTEFVYSFLLFRDTTQPIKRFRLKCPYDSGSDFRNIEKWVRFALQLGGVEYLELDFGDDWLDFVVPIGLVGCIFSCRTLVVLKWCGPMVIDVSSAVELPSLKIMHLEDIEFAEDRHLSELLSGCPNLEDFKAKRVSSTRTDFSGKFNRLTKLITADNSESFIYLSIEVISNVKHLTSCAQLFTPYKHIPTFTNLTHMYLEFYWYKWQLLAKVLKHCPLLQVLVIYEKEEEEYESGQEEYFVPPESVPECISSQLTECSIHSCVGKKGELQFATYILINAKVLQTLKIYSHSDLDSIADLKMMKKNLSSCIKGSSMCQLSFHF